MRDPNDLPENAEGYENGISGVSARLTATINSVNGKIHTDSRTIILIVADLQFLVKREVREFVGYVIVMSQQRQVEGPTTDHVVTRMAKATRIRPHFDVTRWLAAIAISKSKEVWLPLPLR